MSSLIHAARDNVLYSSGYFQGRMFSLPHTLTDLYAFSISRITSFISLPLPLLSFAALPFFGGTSTSINLLFFYLTWSVLVFSHDPLTIEIYGTLAVRIAFFLLPAFGFLVLDSGAPSLSKNVKAFGEHSNPMRLGRKKLAEISITSTANILLSVALQALLEVVFTKALHMRSILKVTTVVPLPWTIVIDIAKGFALRGVLHYSAHRYLLHTYDTPLKTWHAEWQHSLRLPFSLVAAYDHPACFIVGQWLPTFLPAMFLRFHVLTWHIFLALASLEQLFIYSGYAALPSTIMLTGMARRTDAHFATFKSGQKATNFGNWGVLDFAFGTSCQEAVDVVDDLQEEADKHHVKDRAHAAIDGAQTGLKDEETKRREDSRSRSGSGRGRGKKAKEQKSEEPEKTEKPEDQGTHEEKTQTRAQTRAQERKASANKDSARTSEKVSEQNVGNDEDEDSAKDKTESAPSTPKGRAGRKPPRKLQRSPRPDQ